MRAAAIVVAALLQQLVAPLHGCPSEMCVCKWKGGKQTVECGGRYLSTIPIGMDPGTQVLNFTGNSLTVLQKERFKEMELINLQKIFLARNQISRIHERAFRGLTNLVELDLSENMISVVPTETFQDYSALMRLSLNGNPIRELRTSAFRHLSYLTTLEISSCQIERVDDGAFNGLDNLEWLRLDGNRIKTIRGHNILPTTLHGISLHANRWNCDCRLVDFHRWLTRYSIPQTEEPRCLSPLRLADQVIKTVRIDDLACLPEIEPTMLFLEISEGRNISLLCKINATPAAEVSWWFQGQILQNDTYLPPNYRLYFYVDEPENPEQRQSELFIYNVNTSDNGTFSCVAENSAGRMQANYTIRVVVKEEPIVEPTTFPYEYYLVVFVGAACVVISLLIVICVLVCRCRSKTKRKRRKGPGKEVSFQLDSGGQKCVSITNEADATCSKLNGSILMTNNNPQEMMLYIASGSQNVELPQNSGNYTSPQGGGGFQEQNPDLINDTESGKTKSRDADTSEPVEPPPPPINLQAQPGPGILKPPSARFGGGIVGGTLPRNLVATPRDLYQHQVDVHLSPGCFLDQNGYPVEFTAAFQTLPQPNPTAVAAAAPVNYYRTLPHKRHAAPTIRYSNEAEFITRTTQTCQTYAPSVRYTVDGYLYAQMSAGDQFPSPPEGYKSDQSTGMVSPGLQSGQWPACLPGFQVIPIKTQSGHEVKRYPSPQTVLQSPVATVPVTKKCVSAQTSDNDVIPEQEEEDDDDEQPVGRMKHLSGPLADSPDEGYVGDSQDGSDM